MWTEEQSSELLELVGTERPVSQDTVAAVAAQLDRSTRSISSKLRKMGEEVDKVTPRGKTFSEEEELEIRNFLETNPDEYTYAEVAAQVCGGKFSAKAVQGKVLSMELTSAVKETPKKVAEKKYTEEEEATISRLAQSGAFLEDIAEALGKSLQSVRGKALSMIKHPNEELRLACIPTQRDKKEKAQDPLEALGDISELTVEEIAESIGKSPRGVRAMITHRGLKCKDYTAKKKVAA